MDVFGWVMSAVVWLFAVLATLSVIALIGTIVMIIYWEIKDLFSHENERNDDNG